MHVMISMEALKVVVELIPTPFKSPLYYIYMPLARSLPSQTSISSNSLSIYITMASNVGKLHVEVELKSPAEKFWVSLRDSTEVFPKAFPHDYKSIDVLEGDGKAVGSIRLITYSEGKEYIYDDRKCTFSIDLACPIV